MARMSSIRFACQTYSWQMSLDRYRGRVGHIAQVATASGFSAIEPEMVILGDDRSPAAVLAAVHQHQMTIPSLVYVDEWETPAESPSERANLQEALTLAKAVGATRLVLVQNSAGRHELAGRQRVLMDRLDAIADRASEFGVSATFHPNSSETSLFRDAADYDRLEEILPVRVGFTPDLGHVAKGGMDVMEVVRRFRDRIDHMHIKDMFSDGSWAPTGEGVVDIEGVVRYLDEIGFDGWIAFEDESQLAQEDPDEAVRRTGAWVRANLAPYAIASR